MAFQVSWIHSQPPVLWGWYAKKYPDVKTAMAIFPDNRIGHALSRKTKKMAKVFGIELAEPTFYPRGTTDFSAIATKITRTNPDMFTTAGGGTVQDSLLYKALYESEFKGRIFTINAIGLGKIEKVIPLKMVNGMISAEELIRMDNAPPIPRDFKKAYTEKYGAWDDPTTMFNNQFYCLMTGLMKANSTDPQKVAAVIGNGMKFDSIAGEIQMISRPDMGNDRTVDSLLTAHVRQVVDGKGKLLQTVSLNEGYGYLKKFYGWK
jgi:ABC-type branched-subunit amino acid transport system substrate-binding protein